MRVLLGSLVIIALGAHAAAAQKLEALWYLRGEESIQSFLAHADQISVVSPQVFTMDSTGGYPWMLACLKYVLSLGVPPSKISLGLAGYSDWWYPAYDEPNGSRLRGSDISYAQGMEILSRARVTPVWDDMQKSPYAMWEEHGVFQHMWLEDASAFMAKLELVRTYGLRGYSVWLLGSEDPTVWDALRLAGSSRRP